MKTIPVHIRNHEHSLRFVDSFRRNVSLTITGWRRWSPPAKDRWEDWPSPSNQILKWQRQETAINATFIHWDPVRFSDIIRRIRLWYHFHDPFNFKYIGVLTRFNYRPRLSNGKVHFLPSGGVSTGIHPMDQGMDFYRASNTSRVERCVDGAVFRMLVRSDRAWAFPICTDCVISSSWYCG
jgi:hypothetical protein